MACSKQPRHRETTDDSPNFVLDVWWQSTPSGGATVHTDNPVTTNNGYHTKSIHDFHCVRVPETDSDGTVINPCKGLDAKQCREVYRASCADCVKQSKASFNYVSSYKTTLRRDPALVSLRETKASVLHEAQLTHGNIDPSIYKGSIHMPPIALTALELSDAMRYITPSVEKFLRGSATNIYETVFELNKLKDLLKIFKVTKSKTPVSERYLAYNFGYVPLISVIENVLDVIIKLDNIIDTWNDFAVGNKVMAFHANIRTAEDNGSFQQVIRNNANLYQENGHDVLYSWSSTAKLHLYIKPHIIPGHLRYRVLLKSLGIDKPIAGLWEVIPFSWLVDYFVNVDDMIDSWFTGLDSMFKFDVASLGYSTRQSFSIEVRDYYTAYDGGVKSAAKPSLYTSTSFMRQPLPGTALRDAIIPTEWGWADGPSGQQVTYMVAVASAITKRGV